MADPNPITPPPELVQQWIQKATGPDYEQRIATQAARWAADQETDLLRAEAERAEAGES